MMKQLPRNPHAIIEIDRPGAGGGLLRWDSWEMKRRFKNVRVELVTNETSEARFELFDPKFRILDSFSGSNRCRRRQ